MMRAILETTPSTSAAPSIVVNSSGDNAFNNATVSVNVPSISPEPDLPVQTNSKKSKRKRPATKRRISATPPRLHPEQSFPLRRPTYCS